MIKQAKALTFADALEWGSDYPSTLVEVADELRRQHAVNAQLLAALKTLLSVAHQEFDGVPGFGGELTDTPGNRAISIARAAIAKAEAA